LFLVADHVTQGSTWEMFNLVSVHGFFQRQPKLNVSAFR
jgi:hypothetical protein